MSKLGSEIKKKSHYEIKSVIVKYNHNWNIKATSLFTDSKMT